MLNKNTRSLINKLKSNDPSIDPCGNPAITFLSELNLLLIVPFVFCSLKNYAKSLKR